jgi:hypothetical protein
VARAPGIVRRNGMMRFVKYIVASSGYILMI